MMNPKANYGISAEDFREMKEYAAKEYEYIKRGFDQLKHSGVHMSRDEIDALLQAIGPVTPTPAKKPVMKKKAKKKVVRRTKKPQISQIVKEMIDNANSEVRNYEQRVKEYQENLDYAQKKLDEARRIQTILEIAAMAENDSAMRESLDQLTTVYNLKKTHK